MFSFILKTKIKWTAPLNVLLSFGINLLVFYHECRSLTGYATHYPFCYR